MDDLDDNLLEIIHELHRGASAAAFLQCRLMERNGWQWWFNVVGKFE